MGNIIIISIVVFLVGAIVGFAVAPAIMNKKKEQDIDEQIEQFVESDGSCEDNNDDNDNEEEPQLKSAQVSDSRFEIGDIVMKDYAIENPFAQDSCMLIINKQRNSKGVMYYEYMPCNKQGIVKGMMKYSDTFDRCTKVGHKN